MTIHDRIINWLGIESIAQHCLDIQRSIEFTNRALRDNAKAIDAHSAALGRIIAKLDPMYGRPEIDDERRADSDAIGREVIEKLLAEAKARDHTAPL
jgi:hypothetical protein